MPALEFAPTASLIDDLRTVRRESDRIFSIIKLDYLYDRPIDARHRVIFYIGHLDGFDSILICREGLHLPSSDVELDTLFQAGIDPDSAHLPQDQPSDWPRLEQVRDYVERCRNRVDEVLAGAPADILAMALEHRLMHLETLSYMFHNFSFDRKQAQQSEEVVTSGETPDNPWLTVPAGIATLGKRRDEIFGWDNEFDQWTSTVPAFRIQQHSVTNGEYLLFVQDGGPIPNFWTLRNGVYFWRGMFGEIPLPLDWPVYVTQEQAALYAHWIGASLPSEEQFHRAAYGTPSGLEWPYPWGANAPASELGNFDFRRWNPEPVWLKRGTSAFGIDQLAGNGWQWTSTPFGPFPGFQPRPEYPGYSSNFFDGEHFVLKGASPLTGARLLRRSFRNWFRRDYPYMYASFRCVKQD